ncbi:hypothetical protein IFM89_015944 [Coptis chinensis]|uniref:Uncharacterized protein n=1 Tax=Coptis chinensis TaxID=261450 RepID=A0A835LJG8_9MAGN|nr:hypothetical protein IFM89_015944 [Coptis chinensis]
MFRNAFKFGPVEGALFPDYESDLRSGPMVPAIMVRKKRTEATGGEES